jgi:hypothetical protein
MVSRFPSRSSRGPGFLAPVVREIVHELDTSVGAPEPHDFAVRDSTARLAALPASTASLPTFRDDSAYAPLAGVGWDRSIAVSTKGKSEKFFATVLDMTGKSVPPRRCSRSSSRATGLDRRANQFVARISKPDAGSKQDLRMSLALIRATPVRRSISSFAARRTTPPD